MDDVLIVGPCAAGKSTLAQGLRAHGFSAHLVAQEHSGIAHLWRRHEVRAMLYLDVDLPNVHRRGRPEFPEWLHQKQHRRLSEAKQAADCYIDTAPLSIPDVLQQALSFLAERHIAPLGDDHRPE